MLLKPASELTSAPIPWLWPNYLADGGIAILDGDPGLGKSLVTLDLTARLTTGRPWPDNSPSPGPAAALLLCEEDPDPIILARLNTLGADMARAFLWPRETEPFPRLPAEIDRLEEAVVQAGARLVVIDPIMAFLDSSVNVQSDANVRRALRPLASLADRRRCAILLVRHLNKREGPRALYRGGGSIAFVAACRVAWLVGRDPKMADRFVLAQQKHNFAAAQRSLAYQLPRDAPRVDWAGPSIFTADDLTVRFRPRPRRQLAIDFLRSFLEAGPRTSYDVWQAAKAQGYSDMTMRRAKKDAEVRSQCVIGQGKIATYWCIGDQKAPGQLETPELDDWLKKQAEQIQPHTPLDDDMPESFRRKAKRALEKPDDAG